MTSILPEDEGVEVFEGEPGDVPRHINDLQDDGEVVTDE